MKYKTLIFGTASIYNKLKPLYDNAVKNGNLQIVAIAELQKDSVNLDDIDKFIALHDT